MKKILSIFLCGLLLFCLAQKEVLAQADPGCPTVLVDLNNPPALPATVCVGDLIELCLDTDCAGCDLSAVNLDYTATPVDPGFVVSQNGAQACFSLTAPDGPDPCAPYDISVTLNNVSTSDPNCASGLVGYNAGFLTGNDINAVLGFLPQPLVVTIYPDPANFNQYTVQAGACGVAPTIDVSASTCPPTVAGGETTAAIAEVCTPPTAGVDGAYEYTITSNYPIDAGTNPGGCPPNPDPVMETGAIPFCPAMPACVTCPTDPVITQDITASCGGAEDVVIDFAAFNMGTATFTLAGNGGALYTGNGLPARVTIPANNTCAPIDYVFTATATCDDGTDVPVGAGVLEVTVTAYPVLTAMDATADAATCGTLQVNLMAADGVTMCDMQTQACVNDGDTFMGDFTASVTDPNGCSTLTATTVACAGCTMVPPCPGANIGIQITEVLPDPNSTTINFDTDCNGTAETADEFVEICNTTAADIDMSGYEIYDGSGLVFTFPAGTIIPANDCLVLINAWDATVAAQPAEVIAIGISLGNTGDQVILYDPTSNSYASLVYNGFALDTSMLPAGSTPDCADDFGQDTDGESLTSAGSGTPTPDYTKTTATCPVATLNAPTEACVADGMVNICVDFDADADGVTVDINGTQAVGAAGDLQICVDVPLTNPGCDPIMVDYVVTAICADGITAVLDATGAAVTALSAGMANVYPMLTEAIVQPDCMGNAGSAILTSMDGTECANVAGTAGVPNVCPDLVDTDADLVYDFTTFNSPCFIGTSQASNPIDCAIVCTPTCQGIDIAAGLPVVPTEVCSGGSADICLTLFDAAEGLVINGTIDGAPITLMGVAGANPNELCVTLTAPLNETCNPVDAVIQIASIQCNNGTDYPGILGGATLLDDLTTAGFNPINVPVYPTLTVNTAGDGTCGTLTATLEATDGTVCATAAGSPLACAADGDALAYDFTADVTFTPTADCPLPTLNGTLTCAGCTSTGCGIAAGEPAIPTANVCLTGTGPGPNGEAEQAAVDVTSIFGAPSITGGSGSLVQNYAVVNSANGDLITIASTAMLDLSVLAEGETACVRSVAYTQETLDAITAAIDGVTQFPFSPIPPIGQVDLSGFLNALNGIFMAVGVEFTDQDIQTWCETQTLTLPFSALPGGILPDLVLDLTTVPGLAPDGFCCDFSDSAYCVTVVDCSTIPQDIPTLSQWGLMTLALLLMVFGSVKMAVGHVSLAGLGSQNIPMPFGQSLRLPFNSAILRKAFTLTAIAALVGFVICFAIYGAIFLPDVIGVAIAGPIFAYLMHLLYILETRNKK